MEAPRFIAPEARAKAVSLEHPIAFAGYEYRAIVIKRLTAGEVAAFLDSFRNSGDDEAKVEAEAKKTRFPMFYREDGERVPDEVLDALDDDDSVTIDEAATSFLPRRFQSILIADTSPATGEPTAP